MTVKEKRREALGFEVYFEATLSCGEEISLPIDPNDTDSVSMSIVNYAGTPGRFLPIQSSYYAEPVFIRADRIEEFSIATREEIRDREQRNIKRMEGE